jgi:hypothetical protein
MSFEGDIEKQAAITTTPMSPNSTKSLSAIESYQLFVGDIDKPITATDDSIYHDIIVQEQSVKNWYYVTAFLMYTAIAMQVILCLGIVVGAQRGLSANQISILAAVNTGVAATIGVLKALGLPDRQELERRRLQDLADRIRVTTRKLKAGIEVDVAYEADEARKAYRQTEDEARLEAADFSAAASTGLKAFKKRG